MKSSRQPSNVATAKVASYITSLRYEDLPAEVIEKAKQHILDTLGAMVCGARLDVGKSIVKFAHYQPGKEESTVVGTSFKTLATSAALINGTLCHADEVDDVGYNISAHPGCGAVPAALVVGEREKANGKAFINAVVLGYDIGMRVAESLSQDGLTKRNLGSNGVSACFGSVAAASSLLGLSKEQVFSALGLAGEQASCIGSRGSFDEPTHMAKAFQYGVAARSGVTAALLAKVGFQGIPDVFGGEANILDAISGGHNSSEQLIKDLGSNHHIMDAFIKRYPVGGPIQAPLGGLLQIMLKQELQAKDLQEIIVGIPDSVAWIVRNRAIHDINLEFVMAAAACYGKLGWEEIHSESTWKNPEVQDLKTRVKLVGTSSADRRSARIEVVTTDGKRHSITLEARDIPFSKAQIKEKFLDLASPVLGLKKAHKAIDTTARLEEMTDISELADLLRI